MTRKYTLSREGTVKRQAISLKSNRTSEVIRKLSSCHTCPLRNICDKYKEFSPAERNKGCQDVRTIYYRNLKQYTKPEIMLMKTLAELETQIHISELLDGEKGKVCSAERYRLFSLKEKFLEKIFKYGKGTVTTHIHKFDDEEMIDYSEVEHD